ncbi:LysR family transcriptional regulator [Bosea sp. NPDC055332]
MVDAMTLDVDAVRAFVAIAEQRSFTRAATALGSHQAAVSLRLKRLEERLGHRLIERTPRLVRLSAQGAMFLDEARAFLAAHDRALSALCNARRRFCLGIAAHVFGPEVPTLLARLNAHDPGLMIEVQLGHSRPLLEAFDKGELDAAIVRRDDDRRPAEVLAPESFGWFAAPSFEHRQGEPLRLAMLSSSCGVRDIATKALDAAGIPWVEVFIGGGSIAVDAAVAAGLAVSAFSCRLAPAGTVEVSYRFGLPDLPTSEIVMVSTLTDARSRAALRTLAAAFREHRPIVC